MPIFRAQCVFPYGSGLAEDVITNTLHFDIPAPLDPELQIPILTGFLSEFHQRYHEGSGGGGYCNFITWSAAHVNWYNLSDPPPRVPVVEPLAFPGISTSPVIIPAETSVVASFQGDRISGSPQARRRGRLYLAGMVNVTGNSSTTAPPRVPTTLVEAVNAAMIGLRSDAAGAGCPWVVWSQTNAAAVEVTNGWTDNEPDTQRRRGVGANLRTTWATS